RLPKNSSQGREVIFCGLSGRQGSACIRGIQVAEEIGGTFVPRKELALSRARRARAIVWVKRVRPRLVRALQGKVAQVLDMIEFREELDQVEEFAATLRSFDHVIINTAATKPLLEEMGWQGSTARVIPHHHCNTSAYRLPEDRLVRPRVVG